MIKIKQIADGTDGELFTWDADGKATTVAVGTATHVLTSNGEGVAPTFQLIKVVNRVASTASDTTAAIDSDSYDEYYLTAMAAATEITITGTPTEGQTIFIGLKDDNDAGGYTITWTGITALGVTLPVTTTANKQHIIGLKYIAAAWRVIAVGVEE